MRDAMVASRGRPVKISQTVGMFLILGSSFAEQRSQIKREEREELCVVSNGRMRVYSSSVEESSSSLWPGVCMASCAFGSKSAAVAINRKVVRERIQLGFRDKVGGLRAIDDNKRFVFLLRGSALSARYLRLRATTRCTAGASGKMRRGWGHVMMTLLLYLTKLAGLVGLVEQLSFQVGILEIFFAFLRQGSTLREHHIADFAAA